MKCRICGQDVDETDGLYLVGEDLCYDCYWKNKQYYVTVQHETTGEIVVWLIDEDRLLKEIEEDITKDHLNLVSVIPVDMPKPILT